MPVASFESHRSLAPERRRRGARRLPKRFAPYAPDAGRSDLAWAPTSVHPTMPTAFPSEAETRCNGRHPAVRPPEPSRSEAQSKRYVAASPPLVRQDAASRYAGPPNTRLVTAADATLIAIDPNGPNRLSPRARGLIATNGAASSLVYPTRSSTRVAASRMRPAISSAAGSGGRPGIGANGRLPRSPNR
jgi:hypothetical protein